MQPLEDLRPNVFRLEYTAYQLSVERRQKELEKEQREELQALIEQQTAAYISDKARCAVRVETKVENGVPLPWRAELERDYERELSDWIGETVGIPKERQAWHGGEN